jgi:hypothetical protein
MSYICFRYFTQWGALIVRAEIIPLEPDAGSAAEGKVFQELNPASLVLINH